MIAAIKDNRNPTTDEHRQVLLLMKMSRNDQNVQIANILWNYYNHKSANKTLDRCLSDMLIMINTTIIANILIVFFIIMIIRCLSDMLTDGYFFIPDQLTVKLMSKFNEKVFNFILTEVSSDNFISKYWDIEFDPSLSPSHGEDIPYLFDYVSDERNISKREQFSSERRQERRFGGADGPG